MIRNESFMSQMKYVGRTICALKRAVQFRGKGSESIQPWNDEDAEHIAPRYQRFRCAYSRANPAIFKESDGKLYNGTGKQ